MRPFRARGYDLFLLPDARGSGLWEGIWVEPAEGAPRAASVGDLLELDAAWRADVLLGAPRFRVERIRMGAFRPVLGWCLLEAVLAPPEAPGGRWKALPTGRPPEAVALRVLPAGLAAHEAEGALVLAEGSAGTLIRLDPGGRIRLGAGAEAVEVFWVPPGPPIARRGDQILNRR